MRIFSKLTQFRDADLRGRQALLSKEIEALHDLSTRDNLDFKKGVVAVINAARITNFTDKQTALEEDLCRQQQYAIPQARPKHYLYQLPIENNDAPTQYLFHKKNGQYKLVDTIASQDRDSAIMHHRVKSHLITVLNSYDNLEDTLPGFSLLKLQLLKVLITTADLSQRNLEHLIEQCIASYELKNDENTEKKNTLENFKRSLIKSSENLNYNIQSNLTDVKYLDGA